MIDRAKVEDLRQQAIAERDRLTARMRELVGAIGMADLILKENPEGEPHDGNG